MLYGIRMLLLALHFVGVGLLGLLIGVCRPFNPANSPLFARLYAKPALRILGLDVRASIDTLHALPPGYVIVANHQSNHDLFVLGGIVPERTVSMGKKSLKWVPLFGQLYWLSGNVLVDRSNAFQARKALKATTRTLREQHTSIWVFPEGTRNPAPELLPFKKGAFQMAIDAGVPIVPVCVSHYAKGLNLNRWRSGRVEIQALPPLPTEGLGPEDIPALRQACQAQMQACIEHLDQRAAQG
ncbi:lysophospholipid acyltransferase family protein [Pseudomonas sp. nanlin1]|uniref:lysophospholipid acyltransferase family protein n=1 Tax=Pseudomonas sp. nanlin1 TaxID=3040605 RepID=UPI00388DB7B4